MSIKGEYDLIVCGGGHAGCEAINIASKFKINVLLITSNLDTLSQMNCNPSVGGQAKGHLVCEIDSLGGVMGKQANDSGIHFKLLNSSKGESVQSPRIQCDKVAYSMGVKQRLSVNPRIKLLQASVEEVIVSKCSVKGVRLNLGFSVYSKAVIITTGTYINGDVFIGKSNHTTRYNQFGKGLSQNFKSFGVETRVFKTGTPPRVLGSSINFSKCYRQKSDKSPTYFGYAKQKQNLKVFRDCWITNTNLSVHSWVYDNIHNSRSYSKENYMGPRYCPSIEDKIIKFKTNPKHKVFLEPESLKTDEWYVSGVSNSLPLKLQYKLLKNIKGLEGCFITKPGYSIQYDYIPSVNITPSLECKNVKGLFLAGQINGTTGYEEAASQGLVAGLNASLYVLNEKPVYFKGENSYIGVLVNDIASKEVLEPYRVFTYRADNRLVLNYESACFRMLSISKAYMLLGKDVIHNLTLQNKLIQSWTSYFTKNKRLVNKNFNKLSTFLKRNVMYRLKYSNYLKSRSFSSKAVLNPTIEGGIGGIRNEFKDKWILKKIK